MALSCGANCAKIVLIIVNIIFLLTGLAVLAVGIWMTADQDILKLVDFVVSDESRLFRNAAILLIALGVFVLLVSILGFVGACIEHRVMLTIYIVLLAIVFAGEVACGVVAIIYKNEIRDNMESSLQKSVQKVSNWLSPYYNLTKTKCEATSEGALWDYLQVKFNCCGVHDEPHSGYEFSKISQFCPTLNLTHRPVTCCRHIGDLDALNLDTDDQHKLKKSFNCTHYKTQGCSDALVVWIETYAPVLIGMGIGVGMFELFVIIFALCLCQHITYKET